MAAKILADRNNLARIVVPKALLAQTAQLLHGRLGGLLGREIRHVPFSRKTPTVSSSIWTFHQIHKDIQKAGGVIIALPEHLLSFKLSGLQRLADGVAQDAFSMVKVCSEGSRGILSRFVAQLRILLSFSSSKSAN